MMIQVWKNVHDSYQLVLAQKARDMLLVQEKEVEQFQKNIVKRQEEVYKTLEKALTDSRAGDYATLEKEFHSLQNIFKQIILKLLLQLPFKYYFADKKEKAEQARIRCSFHIILPPKFSQAFSDVTITSLFTNLLDNAIEACESVNNENKFIELNTNYQANMFLIKMKNSKNPENIFTHKTTKKIKRHMAMEYLS